MSASRRISLILWLVAVHSLAVGVGLILLPASAMPFVGLEAYVEKFFPVQGGVFHIVMAVAYSLAASAVERFRGLAIFAIVAKFTATVFLLVYFFSIKQGWIVLISGIGDGLMGTAILWAFLLYKRSQKQMGGASTSQG